MLSVGLTMNETMGVFSSVGSYTFHRTKTPRRMGYKK